MKGCIDIIIVNWCSGDQLHDVVSSIEKFHGNEVASVIVVDNASTDDSLSKVEKITDLPFPIHIIRNTQNLGFGVACNQGAEVGQGEYILFLNPDTRLHENSLTVPLRFMREPKNDKVGICGIQLIDEDGRVSRTCARFPSLAVFMVQMMGLNKLPGFRSWSLQMDDWAHTDTRDVDHVIGAFYFVRRAVFESLNGFDKRFFVYLEDLDLSLRANQAGWRSVYLATVRAFHAGGGTSRNIKAARLFYSLRSRLLYGIKHLPKIQAWTLIGLTLMVEPFPRVIFALLRGGLTDVANTFTGYRMLYAWIFKDFTINKQGLYGKEF